jgi:polyphosphate kinase 2 (PPK2 family)
MHISIETDNYIVSGKKKLELKEHKTKIKDLYKNKGEYKGLIDEFQEEIDKLQQMMYAHDRYSMLLIFQAMVAAGKDGTIRAIMSGVNVHGVSVHSFKQPSAEERDHDFLWRTTIRLPQRGRIGIFNRSYYEEVLVVKVHPEIVRKHQQLPEEYTSNLEKLWDHRYESIAISRSICGETGRRS